jgi:hypothetical protein
VTETKLERGDGPSRWLEWVLLDALLGYTILIFYGIGPPAEGIAQHWYEPRTFLRDIPGIASLFESIAVALASATLPALVLCGLVFRAGRSAWARAVAISCVVATSLFVFYGVQAPLVWEFFHWRGSAVLWLLAFTIGLALSAPLLARSWLRLGWPLRAALYLPFVFIVLAFMRNATGTDQSLRFAISPWPVVSVFGIETATLFIAACMLGIAIGVWAIAQRKKDEPTSTRRAFAGLILGILAPATLLKLGSYLDMLAFGVGAGTVVFVSALTAIAIVAAGNLGVRGNSEARFARARGLLVGALLVGIPLLSGSAIARYDYHKTRERDARAIIDALAAYVEDEFIYPDDLEALVASKHLESVPTPSIGFDFLYDGEFRYQSFGTSFLLEFPAPRWVECAYTPPYDDEDYEDDYENGDDDAGGAGAAETGERTEDESLDESWSCPSKPPELW